jgi:hypothetical protein
MSDIVWFAFLRGSVLPLLHVSWVFLNGMICRARDFHPCSNLFVWIPFPFVVFPAAFVHGFYDAVLPYENLPGFSGLAVLVLQWAIILVFIGALFLALYGIKVSAGDSKPDLRVSEAPVKT